MMVKAIILHVRTEAVFSRECLQHGSMVGVISWHISREICCRFDPLGLCPKDKAEFDNLQTKEINNGRLAMIGVAGFVAQELVNGKGIIDNLMQSSQDGCHLSVVHDLMTPTHTPAAAQCYYSW
eukprot:TRINITY_DN35949_c0_g1_i1.p1 TRINITY_DN35949_c0_g1~~TRINITY_DN35949_c0_g1_i1.p1  ORF type:complete len:124 (-),score=9.07 TRINITY_DN35949_c0_g1_i1:248-619(-)